MMNLRHVSRTAVSLPRMSVVLLVTAVLLPLAVDGCGRRQNWHFALQPDSGKAKIDMDNVTLIFEGVPFDHPAGGIRGPTTGTLAIAGPGTAMITVTVDGKSFKNSYADGVNTMSFEGHTLKLLDRGTKLRIGTQDFDLTGEKKTIVVGQDGTAQARAAD